VSEDPLSSPEFIYQEDMFSLCGEIVNERRALKCVKVACVYNR